MRFQASELSLHNPSGLAYLKSFPKGMPVSTKGAFTELGRYVLQSILDEQGPAADARIPLARVVDKANKVSATLDLAPLFGELRAVAVSYGAKKTDGEILRSAVWFYENVEKPAKKKAGVPSKPPEAAPPALPPEGGSKSFNLVTWAGENPWLAGGIVVGTVSALALGWVFLGEQLGLKQPQS